MFPLKVYLNFFQAKISLKWVNLFSFPKMNNLTFIQDALEKLLRITRLYK